MTLPNFLRAACLTLILVRAVALAADERVKLTYSDPSVAVDTLQSRQEWPIAGAQAWSGDTGEFVTLRAPYLNLYTAPGRGYPIFHVAEKNEKLRIFKRKGDWYQLETENGKRGWAHRNTLSALQDNQGLYLDVTNPGWRDAASNPVQFSVLGGSTSGAITYSSILGYRFTPNISSEIRYTQAFGNASTLKVASLTVVHQPCPLWRLAPFVTLGTGAISSRPNAVILKPDTRQDSFISVGAGLFFHATARIGIRAEYIKDTVLTRRESNEEIEEWKAGFSLLF